MIARLVGIAFLCAVGPTAAGTPRIPLRFEQESDVRFVSRGTGPSLTFSPNAVVLHGGVRIHFAGANPHPSITLHDQMPGLSNYLTGSDQSLWRTSVTQFASLRYHNLYPGIDLVFYGRDQQLEYDFIVAPGADPCVIDLQFEGAAAHLNAAGDLVLRASGLHILNRKPILFQQRDGHRSPVAGNYILQRNHARFATGPYDHRLPLVIDPVLTYSTYLGGTLPNAAEDIAYAIARDPEGNIYITGRTSSSNFPLQGALQTTNKGSGDAFVAKFDPTGQTLKYATYIGGGSLEYAYAIAVDPFGQAHIAGQTGSRDFPVKNAFQPSVAGLNNAFITKLNAQGNGLIFSTILGGERNDVIYSLALDEFGNVYAGGGTNSAKFPTRNALQPAIALNGDAFASKFSPTGDLIYSTFIGGNGADVVYAVAVDSLGNLVLTGHTNSLNMATANALGPKAVGGREVFVAKLNATGSAYVFYTYLAGRLNDEGRAIALDAAGNIYVAGNTFSTDFPITEGVLQPKLAGNGDGFLAKINDSGTRLLWSTYLGGSGKSGVVEDELINAISLDADGYIYVAGTTTSSDFPTVRAVQPKFGGGTDAFLAKLTPDASTLIFSTFLGGSADEVGLGLVVTPLREAHVTGQTFSADLPNSPKPYQAKRGGNADAFWSSVCDPVLFAGTASFDFYYTQGQTTPPTTQNFDVVACAKLPLNVLSTGEPWLSVTPADSVMPANITVAINPDALDAGDYTTTLTISTPDSWFPPLRIPVRLHILPPSPDDPK